MNNTITTLKTPVLYAICIDFYIYSVQAQKDKKNGIRFGLHSAQLRMDNQDLFDSNNKSLYVGLFREQKTLAGLLRWRTGLEYHQSGSYEDSDNFVRIGYVSLPASLGVNLGPLQAYGGLSGQLRIYVNETIDGERQDPTLNDYSTFDATAFVGRCV